MNQFFFETRSKEKVRNLMNEGQQSQAFYRSRASKHGLLRAAPKVILIIVGILGILELLVH
jgi:hypothetical protein